MKTLPKGPFLGISNRKPDYALHVKGTGDFVRDAVNVDLDNAGSFRRRKASQLLQAQVSPHSLYMTSDTTGYLVRSGSMYAITLPTYTESFFKLLTNNDQVHWLEFNGDLYYSNGTDSGRISSGVVYPLGLPTLDEPVPSSLPGGNLFAGAYQVAWSYYNATTGEEGGVSPSCNYALATDGGLRVTLPAAADGATHVNVYCSTVNGSIPLLCASVEIGSFPTYDILNPGAAREANQRYESPLPAGKLFLFNGCLCSYSGGNVYEGLPFRPGYYLPSEGRIPFPSTVTNCVPAQAGVYVVADKTYWISGQRMTASEMVMDVLPYGGVQHTEFVSPNKTIYGWFGEQGIVFATPQGEVEAIMSDNIKLTPPASGLSVVLETDDYRRVVACGWCMNIDTKAATRYDGYDFTSISRGYGTKADGLYLLEGDGDVEWSIDLGKENFGTEAKKRMPAAYLGCTSSRPLELRIKTPKDDFTYPARSCSDELQEHRVDPGKGLEANWFHLSLQGDSDFTLATVSFAPTASHRRI